MSTTRWFYVQDDKRMGPVDMDQIVLMVTAALSPSTLVWHQGLTEWTEVDRIPELGALLPPPLPGGKPLPRPRTQPLPPKARPRRNPGPSAPPSPPAATAKSRVDEIRRRLEKEPNARAYRAARGGAAQGGRLPGSDPSLP